jgi:hypothetical protein
MSKADVSKKGCFGELSTNKAPTVEEVIKFLQEFDSKQRVVAYEGEGGSWILVHGLLK